MSINQQDYCPPDEFNEEFKGCPMCNGTGIIRTTIDEEPAEVRCSTCFPVGREVGA
jgi:DnaJ-class molecular chaperone